VAAKSRRLEAGRRRAAGISEEEEDEEVTTIEINICYNMSQALKGYTKTMSLRRLDSRWKGDEEAVATSGEVATASTPPGYITTSYLFSG